MKINNCLVLSAGFGTRMGPIGERLPKVMWPVFEKRLIDLQISYARKIGCKKIFVNTHFQSKQIQEHLSKNYSDVIVLHEEEILNVGGAVHNLMKHVGEEQELLILNGDQFYWIEEKYFKQALSQISHGVAVLFGIEVGAGYSEIVVEQGLLKKINTKCSKEKLLTYSGVSIINLREVDFCYGPSNFFDTVADYKNKKVFVISPKKAEYYDFGTADRYVEQMFDVLSKADGQSEFVNFCKDVGIFAEEKFCGNDRYNCATKGIINLSASRVKGSEGIRALVLKSAESELSISSAGLYYDDIFYPTSKDS